MSRRSKVNFETLNDGKYEIIPWEKIYETNKRIKKGIRDFKKKLIYKDE